VMHIIGADQALTEAPGEPASGLALNLFDSSGDDAVGDAA
jgi:hypothetical protein